MERQACAAFLHRYWQKPALVRLCRCERRLACSITEEDDVPSKSIPLNNRAHFKFCHPTTSWPQCTSKNEITVTVGGFGQNLNPDILEALHHKGIQLSPPAVTFRCRCSAPQYWKLVDDDGDNFHYKCTSLAGCNTGDFCGHFSEDLNALYQSCFCPNRNICVHNGGLNYVNITEILYRGKGLKAYCQKYNETIDSYEDL